MFKLIILTVALSSLIPQNKELNGEFALVGDLTSECPDSICVHVSLLHTSIILGQHVINTRMYIAMLFEVLLTGI